MAVTVSVGSRPNPAERRRVATRERLLEAGRKLFAERGLHGVTTHDIAAQAGFAAGTFYLHFRDKAELFRVIAEETIELLREHTDAATREPRGTRAGVRPFTEALVGFAEENRDMVRILFSRDSEAAAVEANVLNEFAASIAANRRGQIETGELSPDVDPDVLAQAVVGLLARVVAWWVEDPSRAPRAAVVETLARIQLSGTHPQACPALRPEE